MQTLTIAAFVLSLSDDAPETLRAPLSAPLSEVRATRLAASIVLARLEAWDTDAEIVSPRMVSAVNWYAADNSHDYIQDEAPATLRSAKAVS